MATSSTPKILLKHLSKPKTLQRGPYLPELTERLSEYFETKVFPVNSGRSAIYLALKSLDIGNNDEVLLQAYTCNAVPNPILWAGAIPVYVDIDEDTLNMNVDDLKKKITEKTKAIIVQHTFGNPAKIKEILKIADARKLKVIEDCAHSLGGKVDNRKLGTFGDLAILSFGREKVISSLTGGALIVNDKSLYKKVEDLVVSLSPLPKRKILQEISNYLSWRILFRKIYGKEWGRNIIKHLYQYDFVNVVTSQKELVGLRPHWYPSKMPDVFAHIALLELNNIEQNNKERQKIANDYFKKLEAIDIRSIQVPESIYLRTVVLHPKAYLILEKAREQKLNFGNWYNSVIYPESAHLAKLGYQSGSCPVAEKVAKESLNLPNYVGVTETEQDNAITLLKSFRS